MRRDETRREEEKTDGRKQAREQRQRESTAHGDGIGGCVEIIRRVPTPCAAVRGVVNREARAAGPESRGSESGGVDRLDRGTAPFVDGQMDWIIN